MNVELLRKRRPRVIVVYRYPPDWYEELYRAFHRMLTNPLGELVHMTMRFIKEAQHGK